MTAGNVTNGTRVLPPLRQAIPYYAVASFIGTKRVEKAHAVVPTATATGLFGAKQMQLTGPGSLHTIVSDWNYGI